MRVGILSPEPKKVPGSVNVQVIFVNIKWSNDWTYRSGQEFLPKILKNGERVSLSYGSKGLITQRACTAWEEQMIEINLRNR